MNIHATSKQAQLIAVALTLLPAAAAVQATAGSTQSSRARRIDRTIYASWKYSL